MRLNQGEKWDGLPVDEFGIPLDLLGAKAITGVAESNTERRVSPSPIRTDGIYEIPTLDLGRWRVWYEIEFPGGFMQKTDVTEIEVVAELPPVPVGVIGAWANLAAETRKMSRAMAAVPPGRWIVAGMEWVLRELDQRLR